MIREAQLEDLPAIRRLYAALLAEKAPVYPAFDEEDLGTFTRATSTILATPRPESFFLAVVEVDERVVGFILGEHEMRLLGSPHELVTAHYLYVEPAHRGVGLGRQLVAAGLGWVAGLGVTAVELGAYVGDTQWERRGWQPVFTRYASTTEKIARAMLSSNRAESGDVNHERGVVAGLRDAVEQPEDDQSIRQSTV